MIIYNDDLIHTYTHGATI